MVTHFERSATQVFLEQSVGCTDPAEFVDYIEKLEDFEFTLASEAKFATSVDLDVQGQFERHCLALMQGTVDLEAGNRMWAIVKLYYALFYAVRAELHLQGFSIIRCKRLYLVSGARGSRPSRFNNKERGDHGVTFEVMKKRVGEYDVLQTQSISGENPYFWMKNLREIAQYKLRRPVEISNFDPFFDPSVLSIEDQISMFLADKDPFYCFDEDYAALALAVTRFRITLSKMKSEGIVLSKDFQAVAAKIARNSKAASQISSYLI
jgi:hypothetical protein